MSFRCCGKHIQCFRECGASGSATAARTSGPCAKESCRTPILNKQFHSWRSNQQVNYLTLRRPWCTRAVWSACEFLVDDVRDCRRHEQGRHSRRVTTVSGWLQRSFAVWLLYLRAGFKNICKNVQESSNYDSRLANCVHRFPSFSMFLHVELRPFRVCREHMWPWWRERNFSSPTRSSSSSELGPETGVCLELDVKLSAAMVTLAVARCQQVIWVNPQPRFRCRLVWGSSVHHYIDGRNVRDLHNNNLVNRSIKL